VRNTTPHNSHPPKEGKVVFADDDAAGRLAGHVRELTCPDETVWRIVKQNSSRTVYCGRLAGLDVYLKHYHSRSWAHRIRRWLGVSDALREFRFSRYLCDRGVPTPPPLAARCDRKVEWFVTRAVAPATPAEKWHEKQLRAGGEGKRRIQPYLVALGTLIGRMHRAGVVHRDLHCGNVLLRTNGEAPQPVLMDLHRAFRRRRLPRRRKAANLAQLFYDRRNFTTRTERLRFLKHYLAAGEARGTVRGWLFLINLFARRHTRKQYAQRDRRVVGDNRYFATIRRPHGWRGHVVLASKRHLAGSRAAEVVFHKGDWEALLTDIDALFDDPSAKIVKETRFCRIVRRTLPIGPYLVDAFLKRPRQKPAKFWIDWFRPSRAMRAFQLGHALLTRRIATALPLAALERRRGPFLRDSLLITETVRAPHLYDFMNTWLSEPPKGDTPLSPPQQRQLAQEVLWQLGRMLQQLHDNRYSHRDLKATNIRVRWDMGNRPEVVLLDLDGMRRVHCMTAQRRLRGLMRLNVSLLQCPVVNHAGRLRMLLGYLRRPGCGRINFKPYWRVLEDWSARKLRQQIRSRRRRQRAIRRPA